MPIQDRGRNAPIVDPEPGAAGEEVEAGDDLGAVRPVPTRRLRRAVDHLIAVGADDDRPFVLGPAQDDKGAHAASAALQRGTFRPPIGLRYYEARGSRHRHGDRSSMTTFDEREKDFEARYKHDQEL